MQIVVTLEKSLQQKYLIFAKSTQGISNIFLNVMKQKCFTLDTTL